MEKEKVGGEGKSGWKRKKWVEKEKVGGKGKSGWKRKKWVEKEKEGGKGNDRRSVPLGVFQFIICFHYYL